MQYNLLLKRLDTFYNFLPDNTCMMSSKFHWHIWYLVADPQTLVEEKETVQEKLAISEYELRLAQEDLSRLKKELQKLKESYPDGVNGLFFIF